MRTTYKELFDELSALGTEIDAGYFKVQTQLFVQTPDGFAQIRGVFKKAGAGQKLTLDNGAEIRAENKHTLMTSTGLQFIEDAVDAVYKDGTVKKVVCRESIPDVDFYDISIDAPHLYYGSDGFLHHNTYTIMQVIEKSGLEKGKDYIKLSGKASPLSIYQTLFMFREGGLIIFDDLDSMWGNADATNILKAALDTSAVREIAWGSTNTINVSRMGPAERKELFLTIDQKIMDSPDRVKFPSQFDFKGQVIFISNLKKEEFDTAIMSRSAKICMDLSPDQILKRMRDLLPTLGGTDVSIEMKTELVDHLLDMHAKREIDAVTMREFVKGVLILKSGAPNWRDLVIYS